MSRRCAVLTTMDPSVLSRPPGLRCRRSLPRSFALSPPSPSTPAEIEAMYSLRKYRAMKQRYYDEPPNPPKP
ncbi:hypothetical protein AAT19DRAFT_8704 [Rhodotorula toruloides]|uniref:Uncharacterized protein n=1 Tax=Rhodotorula toruloides TaxID=5286 RepID=A0A2T0AI01_RHOTO|nr:hypothetical protein AAT19DRAFT_8704 [Rhodotorula toruloides]